MKPAQAGALTTPLPESCRAASSARIASRALWSALLLAESAAFVAYEASSVASALAPWSAVTLAPRLASCAATKASVARPSRAFAILVSTSSGSPSSYNLQPLLLKCNENCRRRGPSTTGLGTQARGAAVPGRREPADGGRAPPGTPAALRARRAPGRNGWRTKLRNGKEMKRAHGYNQRPLCTGGGLP